MRGGSCHAQQMLVVGVAIIVRFQFGVHPKIRATMQSKLGVWWVVALKTEVDLKMKNYDFTLAFSLPDGMDEAGQLTDALFEAGCDDALVGTGVSGVIALDFSREAESADAAIESAIKNVMIAVPGAELIETKPDLVGVSDLAGMLDCTRQNMRKYTIKNSDFPAPVFTGKLQLWHLNEVAGWFSSRKTSMAFSQELIDISRLTFRHNIELQQIRYEKEISRI